MYEIKPRTSGQKKDVHYVMGATTTTATTAAAAAVLGAATNIS